MPLFTGFIGALVSAGILATMLAVCVLAIITFIRVKKRLQNQLASYKNVMIDSEICDVASNFKPANIKVDTTKNIAYEPNPVDVETRNNDSAPYQPNTVAVTVAVETKKNISYVVHTPSK